MAADPADDEGLPKFDLLEGRIRKCKELIAGLEDEKKQKSSLFTLSQVCWGVLCTGVYVPCSQWVCLLSHLLCGSSLAPSLWVMCVLCVLCM